MNDRTPTRPNRFKVTKENGTSEYVTLERADEPTQVGTPINKNTLFNSNNTTRFGCELPSEAFDLIGKEWTVTVPKSGWSAVQTNGYYTNRVNISDMKSIYNPILSLKVSSVTVIDDEQVAFGAIDICETYNGYILLKARTKPDISFTVRLKGV